MYFSLQLSSLSIDNQEDVQFPYAMRDLPPASQLGEQQQSLVNCEAPNGRLPCPPGTPPQPYHIPCHPSGSPTVPPRPLRQLVSQVSVECPSNPSSRPQSPWCRFDPYDSPEVCFYVLLCAIFRFCPQSCMLCSFCRIRIKSTLVLPHCLTRFTERRWRKVSHLRLWWLVSGPIYPSMNVTSPPCRQDQRNQSSFILFNMFNYSQKSGPYNLQYFLNYLKNQCRTASFFLAVGESGLGKSTLINSLFLTDLYKDRKVPNAQGEICFLAYLHVCF